MTFGSLVSTFDDIASKRNVYKIETIGDCYVAVTGLPDPPPGKNLAPVVNLSVSITDSPSHTIIQFFLTETSDHAERMCKFTRDCMDKMHLVTASLAEKMGKDT